MPRLDHILFPTDFSDNADSVIRHAAFLARAYQSKLHILHVYDERDASTSASDLQRKVQSRADKVLGSDDASGVQVALAVRGGEAAAPEIVNYAADENIDLIVIGTHGRRGVRRAFMGSVTEEVVRTAPCPVYTVHRDEHHDPRLPKKVVVPVDFSDYGLMAMRAARRFVSDGGRIVLFHAIEEYVPPGTYGLDYPSYPELTAESERYVYEEMESMADSVFNDEIDYRIEIRVGHAPMVIVDFAETSGADLIVMSTHGRTGIERVLLGSVAERVLRMAEIPTLIVRSFPPETRQE